MRFELVRIWAKRVSSMNVAFMAYKYYGTPPR
jgi:hypothetical protein